jgi:hypothetical protein
MAAGHGQAYRQTVVGEVELRRVSRRVRQMPRLHSAGAAGQRGLGRLTGIRPVQILHGKE